MPKFGEGVRRQPNSGLEGLKHERPLYAAKAVRRFSLLAIFVLFATASGCSDRGDPSGASPARSDLFRCRWPKARPALDSLTTSGGALSRSIASSTATLTPRGAPVEFEGTCGVYLARREPDGAIAFREPDHYSCYYIESSSAPG
jgi:hypothetical protein